MVASDTPQDLPDRPQVAPPDGAAPRPVADTTDRSSAPGAGADAPARGGASPTPAPDLGPRPGPVPPPAAPASIPAAVSAAGAAAAREQAQIAELERFRLAIERLRREREATIAEFRTFVREGAAARRGAAAAPTVPPGAAQPGAATVTTVGGVEEVRAASALESAQRAEVGMPASGAPAGAAELLHAQGPADGIPDSVGEAPPGAAGVEAEVFAGVGAAPSAEKEKPPVGDAARQPEPGAALAPGVIVSDEAAAPQAARGAAPPPQPVIFDVTRPEPALVPPGGPSPPWEPREPAAGSGGFLSATLEETPAPSAARRIAIWATGLLVAATAVFLFVRPAGEPPGSAPRPGAGRRAAEATPQAAGGAGSVAQAPGAPSGVVAASGTEHVIEEAAPEALAPAAPTSPPRTTGEPLAAAATGSPAPETSLSAAPSTSTPAPPAPPDRPGVAAARAAPAPLAESAATTAARPAAGPGAGGGPALAAPVRVEIVTLRPVWIKAVADDVRRFERLVAENQRIAVGARTFVLLRIGDAGAVRLIVNGVDRGVQGRDGQVVTRRFEAGSDSSVPR